MNKEKMVVQQFFDNASDLHVSNTYTSLDVLNLMESLHSYKQNYLSLIMCLSCITSLFFSF